MLKCNDCRSFSRRGGVGVWMGECNTLIIRKEDEGLLLVKRQHRNQPKVHVHYRFSCPYGQPLEVCPGCSKAAEEYLDDGKCTCTNEDCRVEVFRQEGE